MKVAYLFLVLLSVLALYLVNAQTDDQPQDPVYYLQHSNSHPRPLPPRPRPAPRPMPRPRPPHLPVQRPHPRPVPHPVQRPHPKPVPHPVQRPHPRPAPHSPPHPKPVPHPVPRPHPKPVPHPHPSHPHPKPVPHPSHPHSKPVPHHPLHPHPHSPKPAIHPKPIHKPTHPEKHKPKIHPPIIKPPVHPLPTQKTPVSKPNTKPDNQEKNQGGISVDLPMLGDLISSILNKIKEGQGNKGGNDNEEQNPPSPPLPDNNPKIPDPTVPPVDFGTLIVASARSQLGVPFSLGGGGIKGPSVGSNSSVIGFDSTGLAQFAVYQGTGWAIGRTANAQWADVQCQHAPLEQAQAGDLLFTLDEDQENGSSDKKQLLAEVGVISDFPKRRMITVSEGTTKVMEVAIPAEGVASEVARCFV